MHFPWQCIKYSYTVQKKSKIKPKKKSNTDGPSRGVRFAEVDLNEDDDEEGPSFAREGASEEEEEPFSDEEEEEEGDPDEFIDVLDVLDGRGEPESADDDRQSTHSPTQGKASLAMDNTSHADLSEDEKMQEPGSEEDDDDEDEVGEDEEEAEESDQEQISASEDEEGGDVSALDNLERFVTSLDAGQKRKSPEPEAGETAPKAKKRRLLPERTEAGEENEFAAHVG